MREWIDDEVARLDKEAAGENPEGTESNPVPEELRQALGKTPDKKTTEKD